MIRTIAPSYVLLASLVLGEICLTVDQTRGAEAAPPGAPPQLYRHPQHGSPVHADPGDLVLLPGYGFAPDAYVVYQVVADTTQRGPAPTPLPSGQTATSGQIAPLRAPTPTDHALIVRLPAVMTKDQSYALWVVNPPDGISARVLINDARPMWMSPGADGSSPQAPAYVYSTAQRPGLERYLKVVGRNLQPAPGQHTRVRLEPMAAATPPIELASVFANAANTPSAPYVVKAALPGGLPVGRYVVKVSRDGVSWVAVDPDSVLEVRPDPDPVSRVRVDVGAFADDNSGPCLADDEQDDTLCITRAIHYAGLTGGDVMFPAGRWLVDRNCWGPTGAGVDGQDTYQFAPDGYTTCHGGPLESPGDGIQVPQHVSLLAQPEASSRPVIETTEQFGGTWLNTYHPPNPQVADSKQRAHVFTLLGDNVVQGLQFRERYKPQYNTGPTAGSHALFIVGNDVSIVENEFVDSYTAVDAWPHALDAHSPLGVDVLGSKNVTITRNILAVYGPPLTLTAVEEGIIADNVFRPGAGPEPIALGVRGSRRLDVSGNVIERANPAMPTGPEGWRAGFFFTHRASNENLLITGNSFACIGSRYEEHGAPGARADGEAISLDGNENQHGFRIGQHVTGVTSNSLSVSPAAGDTLLSVSKGQFTGHWVQIIFGPGLGQSRKITAARTAANGDVMLTFAPAFDVLPVAGQSRLIVSNQTWQAYIIDNKVDNTCSTTLPQATYDHITWSGGMIGSQANTAALVIASNVLNQTRGIQVWTQYYEDRTRAHTAGAQQTQYVVEIRDNTIEGSFGSEITGPSAGQPHPTNSAGSGISLSTQILARDASGQPTYQPTPNLPGFGVSVSHNVITHAALMQWGAYNTWAIGIGVEGAFDAESPTPGYVDTLVYGNTAFQLQDPWLCPWCVYLNTDPGTTLAITNGVRCTGALLTAPNYPRGTVLCANQSDRGIGDFPPAVPPPPAPSTLTNCP